MWRLSSSWELFYLDTEGRGRWGWRMLQAPCWQKASICFSGVSVLLVWQLTAVLADFTAQNTSSIALWGGRNGIIWWWMKGNGWQVSEWTQGADWAGLTLNSVFSPVTGSIFSLKATMKIQALVRVKKAGSSMLWNNHCQNPLTIPEKDPGWEAD